MGKEEKREAEEKISGCNEREYGESQCKGEGHLKQDAVEEHHMLWQPLIKGKGQKNFNFIYLFNIQCCGACINTQALQ